MAFYFKVCSFLNYEVYSEIGNQHNTRVNADNWGFVLGFLKVCVSKV